MGKLASRIGDQHFCPIIDSMTPHFGGKLLPNGKPAVLIGGSEAARLGGPAACFGPTDRLSMGAALVWINGLLASRQSDSTAHGGVIVTGCSSVVIGGPAVSFGGSGDLNDAMLVAAALRQLPNWALQQLEQDGITFVACRNSVADYKPEMANQHPRGWDKEKRWKDVPGVPYGREIVIATVGHDSAAGPHIPAMGERYEAAPNGGHGSYNLLLHETAHALDRGSIPNLSSESMFEMMYQTDQNRLSKYELQDGSAGREEAFAESFARYYGGDTSLGKTWPGLYSYWRNSPMSSGGGQ